jgi:hypothetical protein
VCEASLHASNSRTARVLARSRTRQNHQTARAYFCKPSNRRILLVGEGNFSFACSLLDIFGSAFRASGFGLGASGSGDWVLGLGFRLQYVPKVDTNLYPPPHLPSPPPTPPSLPSLDGDGTRITATAYDSSDVLKVQTPNPKPQTPNPSAVIRRPKTHERCIRTTLNPKS